MTSWVRGLRGGWLLPFVLSTTAGAVDIIGFLALGGLFTAHITGNVVVLAAHYVTGGFSEVGPLLSVPVFVVVLGLVTLLWSRGKPEDLAQARRRAGVTFPSVVGFVAGCAAGAVLEVHCGLWALALPVILAA